MWSWIVMPLHMDAMGSLVDEFLATDMARVIVFLGVNGHVGFV